MTNTISLAGIDIYQVTPELFRGGRVDNILAMNELCKYGIKTVISLENDKMQNLGEEMWARDFHMKFINIPMGEWERPAIMTLNKISSYIVNRNIPKPIYLHCAHGCDRTGYAVMYYRIKKQLWTHAEAWKECVEHGHKWLWYFYWKKILKEIN